ncbi:MAG: ATP-dependent Zn protease, partial [Cyanobacteria bacterium P01_H01_bin.121]
MSTATLNLIAIFIFASTLLSLIGPILQVPPAVPATLIVGVLGFFTVDTFAWSGLGGTLIRDWFAQRSPAYRDRIAHHEAGHFLVAHLLNVPVTGYSLSAWEALQQGQAGQGGVRFDDQQLQQQLAKGFLTRAIADRYLQVWMAGGVAEKLTFEDVQGATD